MELEGTQDYQNNLSRSRFLPSMQTLLLWDCLAFLGQRSPCHTPCSLLGILSVCLVCHLGSGFMSGCCLLHILFFLEGVTHASSASPDPQIPNLSLKWETMGFQGGERCRYKNPNNCWWRDFQGGQECKNVCHVLGVMLGITSVNFSVNSVKTL